MLEILGFAGTGLVATIPGWSIEIFFCICSSPKASTHRQSPSEQPDSLAPDPVAPV